MKPSDKQNFVKRLAPPSPHQYFETQTSQLETDYAPITIPSMSSSHYTELNEEEEEEET